MKYKFSLKYKWVFLMTVLATMGVGLLTFPGPDGMPKEDEGELVLDQGDEGEGMQKSLAYDDSLDTQKPPTPTPTPIPTPTPMPVYDLVDNNNPDIDALFHDYYAARINNDINKLKTLSSNPSNFITLDELTQITEYDEDYRNIKVYTKKCVEENTYIAYVYYDTKITGIKTLAPNLSKFYIVTDEKGNFKIHDDEMEPAFKEYYCERNNDDDVQRLVDEIYLKMEEAMNEDQDLAEFWSGFLTAN